AAKRMICQEEYNFTEIAERLGFSSLHYFSQWFKKQTKRSPTEYATSVKGQSDE
ncbi:MAG: helix-turn-helix domain-containing protein, partial [Clostridia bacterium]|nr:helix-turn-helix domain-containing protein [Clostridia bacterium]